MAHYFSSFRTSLKLLSLVLCVVLMATAVGTRTQAHEDPDQAGYIAVEGGKIWYRLNGIQHLGKRPAIIVAHGGPGGTHRGNMPYVSLSDEFPVILYDQLGSGKSTRPEGTDYWEVSRFIDEVDAIRKALNLKQVIIAGHSWGGTVSAEYAIRNREGLVAAILSSPLISTPQWEADNDAWKKSLPADVEATLRQHEAAGTTNDPAYLAASQEFYKQHMCRKNPCPGGEDRIGAAPGNGDLYKYMWGTSDFFATGTLKTYDISAELSKIKVPTLMICGEFDEAAPQSCKKYAGMIKDARTTIIPDAGHATMRENEALYLKTVRNFLNTVTQ